MPGWWNGRHEGLKIPWAQTRASSSLAPGTKIKLSEILPTDSAARNAPSVLFKKGSDFFKQKRQQRITIPVILISLNNYFAQLNNYFVQNFRNKNQLTVSLKGLIFNYYHE